MCLALRIRFLMLSLIFVGRNPGGWLQIPSLVQLRCGSLSTCLQTWLPWSRTAVLLLSYSWPGPLDSAFLCVSPSEIISLCRQLGKLRPSGSPCPMDEWTLYLDVLGVVAASRVAMGTSSPLITFGPPLTFKAPASKLIISDEFNVLWQYLASARFQLIV